MAESSCCPKQIKNNLPPLGIYHLRTRGPDIKIEFTLDASFILRNLNQKRAKIKRPELNLIKRKQDGVLYLAGTEDQKLGSDSRDGDQEKTATIPLRLRRGGVGEIYFYFSSGRGNICFSACCGPDQELGWAEY